ncbi:metalloprotease family protein [Methanohalobium sp.]|uniref:metalloprotease family protein n=1 Tax=Methanohalobium sp. TaxID=2837493 RepID=UPI0025F863DB|nr:metalloprotease family protein [Methanohalobium sp.]
MSKISFGTAAETVNTKYLSDTFLLFYKLKELVSIIGIVSHEFSHYIACKLLGLEIYEWKLFTLPKSESESELVFGYFTYENTTSYQKELLINIAPLFFNTLVATSLFVVIKPQTTLTTILLAWMIICFYAKAIPSIQDINNIKDNSKNAQVGLSYYLIIPPLQFLAEVRIFGFDYIIAITLYLTLLSL